MPYPFVKDDNDGVKYLSVVDIIKWTVVAVVIYLVIAALFFSVPTMQSGTWGMLLLMLQVFGIFICLPLIIGLLIYAHRLSKSSEVDDKWERAAKKKTARRMRIVVIFLTVYMIVVYVIHILITIGYTLTHS